MKLQNYNEQIILDYQFYSGLTIEEWRENGGSYPHYNLEEIEYVFKNYKKFERKEKLKEINKKINDI